MKWLLEKIRNYRRNSRRTVSDDYLRGYRRLAKTKGDALAHKGQCFSCRNAVAFVGWHCDRIDGCRWEQCYSREEITSADMKGGKGMITRWVGLPGDDNDKK